MSKGEKVKDQKIQTDTFDLGKYAEKQSSRLMILFSLLL